MFAITFLGTNGSCGYNNGKRAKYGTSTSCVAVRAGGHTLVFDAGTGICGLGGLSGYQNDEIHIFITHYHSDHIRGLLFWDMFFNPGQKIRITGKRSQSGGVRETLDKYLVSPYYPAGLADARAELTFADALAGEVFSLSGGVTVRTVRLSHPGGGLGYRVDCDGKSLCYLSDVGLDDHEDDGDLLAFVHKTDLLVTDSFFGLGPCIPGWGHSSVRECVRLARQGEAGRLALFHYKHTYTDDDITEIENAARAEFPNAFAPWDGLRVEL
jgi:phosphoribosyl 1,2-cyclic phosphodiesterase